MSERAKIITGAACLVLFVLVVVWTNLFGGTSQKEDPFPEEDEKDTVEIAYLYVEMKGEVRLPGIYKVEEGTRLYEVVRLAGGTTETADTTRKNLAAPVIDGGTYLFPERSEDGSSVPEDPGDEKDPVSINTASKDELVSLPNIGPATAENIIAHREEHGPFAKIEDLLDVSGIGEATLDGLEGLITL